MQLYFGKGLVITALAVITACKSTSNSSSNVQTFSASEQARNTKSLDLSRSRALSYQTREELKRITPGINYDPPEGVQSTECSQAAESSFLSFMRLASPGEIESIASCFGMLLVNADGDLKMQTFDESWTRKQSRKHIREFNKTNKGNGTKACLLDFG